MHYLKPLLYISSRLSQFILRMFFSSKHFAHLVSQCGNHCNIRHMVSAILNHRPLLINQGNIMLPYSLLRRLLSTSLTLTAHHEIAIATNTTCAENKAE